MDSQEEDRDRVSRWREYRRALGLNADSSSEYNQTGSLSPPSISDSRLDLPTATSPAVEQNPTTTAELTIDFSPAVARIDAWLSSLSVPEAEEDGYESSSSSTSTATMVGDEVEEDDDDDEMYEGDGEDDLLLNDREISESDEEGDADAPADDGYDHHPSKFARRNYTEPSANDHGYDQSRSSSSVAPPRSTAGSPTREDAVNQITTAEPIELPPTPAQAKALPSLSSLSDPEEDDNERSSALLLIETATMLNDGPSYERCKELLRAMYDGDGTYEGYSELLRQVSATMKREVSAATEDSPLVRDCICTSSAEGHDRSRSPSSVAPCSCSRAGSPTPESESAVNQMTTAELPIVRDDDDGSPYKSYSDYYLGQFEQVSATENLKVLAAATDDSLAQNCTEPSANGHQSRSSSVASRSTATSSTREDAIKQRSPAEPIELPPAFANTNTSPIFFNAYSPLAQHYTSTSANGHDQSRSSSLTPRSTSTSPTLESAVKQKTTAQPIELPRTPAWANPNPSSSSVKNPVPATINESAASPATIMTGSSDDKKIESGQSNSGYDLWHSAPISKKRALDATVNDYPPLRRHHTMQLGNFSGVVERQADEQVAGPPKHHMDPQTQDSHALKDYENEKLKEAYCKARATRLVG